MTRLCAQLDGSDPCSESPETETRRNQESVALAVRTRTPIYEDYGNPEGAGLCYVCDGEADGPGRGRMRLATRSIEARLAVLREDYPKAVPGQASSGTYHGWITVQWESRMVEREANRLSFSISSIKKYTPLFEEF